MKAPARKSLTLAILVTAAVLSSVLAALASAFALIASLLLLSGGCR